MSTEDERKLFVAGLPDSMTEDVLLMPPAGFRVSRFAVLASLRAARAPKRGARPQSLRAMHA